MVSPDVKSESRPKRRDSVSDRKRTLFKIPHIGRLAQLVRALR